MATLGKPAIIPAIMRVDDPYLYKAALEQKEMIEKLARIKLVRIILCQH